MSALDFGLKVAGGLSAGLFTGDLLYDAAKRVGEDHLRSELQDSHSESMAQVAHVLRMRRLDEARRANIERLIRLKPDVYNMVAMGRKVPKGARVIGRIDEDALDRLAIQMSDGTVGS